MARAEMSSRGTTMVIRAIRTMGVIAVRRMVGVVSRGNLNPIGMWRIEIE